MSVSSIIQTAFSGLRVTEAGLDVVSQNVANAGSVGYTRRVLTTEQVVAGNQSGGVRVAGVQRTLDTLVQRQLRLETAGAAYTGALSTAHTALDLAFDRTAGAASLSSLVNTFTGSLQALANAPSPYQNRAAVLSAATDVAGSLNGLSDQVQALRQNAEDELSRGVSSVNSLLQQIAVTNGSITSSQANAASPALQDHQDGLIDQLSGFLDLKVTKSATGAITIATTGGLQLLDGQSVTSLSFEARSPVAPESTYDPDPAKRSLGTITATDPSGNKTDVLATGSIRSGSLAAYAELRDTILPQAQAQLDGLAAGLASALSDKNVAGTGASAAGATGFDLDLSSLQSGNKISLAYTGPGGPASVTFVKVTDPSALPLPPSDSAAGRIGIDFSGGPASAAAQIQAALGSSFAVSNPGGSTLRILDDGAAGTTDVTGLSARATVTGLSTGDPELPLFVDGGRADPAYTGSYDGRSQFTGFAARIAVNPAVASDPSKLVAYAATTPAGDTTRPALIRDRVTSAPVSFTPAAGIGSSTGFTGTIADFAQQVIASQASNAVAATNLNDGQKTVLNAIQDRYSEKAGVNIDTELTQLIQLQTAYTANARVLTAAKDLIDLLFRAVP